MLLNNPNSTNTDLPFCPCFQCPLNYVFYPMDRPRDICHLVSTGKSQELLSEVFLSIPTKANRLKELRLCFANRVSRRE